MTPIKITESIVNDCAKACMARKDRLAMILVYPGSRAVTFLCRKDVGYHNTLEDESWFDE